MTRHSPRHYSTPLGSFAARLGWLKNPRARVGRWIDLDMDRWSGDVRAASWELSCGALRILL